MKKVIKASTQRRWVPFVFAAALLCSAWLPLSAFAAGEVVETQNVNHVRSQGTRMSAQPAGGKFSADKAADGKDDSSDHDSRWSSGDDHPAKDKNTWLQATFAKPTSLSYFKIVFETRDAGAPPTPSNVKAFDIEYKTESGDWKLATTYTRTGDPLATGGYDAVVKVKLDAPIEAKAVRLTNFDVLNGSTAWNGVSVAEFEAYTNEQADAVDTENVNHVQGATAKANALRLTISALTRRSTANAALAGRAAPPSPKRTRAPTWRSTSRRPPSRLPRHRVRGAHGRCQAEQRQGVRDPVSGPRFLRLDPRQDGVERSERLWLRAPCSCDA